MEGGLTAGCIANRDIWCNFTARKRETKPQNPPAPAAAPIAPAENSPESDSAKNEWTKVVRQR